jgi:hypothetical protein
MADHRKVTEIDILEEIVRAATGSTYQQAGETSFANTIQRGAEWPEQELAAREAASRIVPAYSPNIARIILLCEFQARNPEKSAYYEWEYAELIQRGRIDDRQAISHDHIETAGREELLLALDEFFRGSTAKLTRSLDLETVDDGWLNRMLLHLKLKGMAGEDQTQRWKLILHSIVELYEWDFRRVGESRNEVFMLENTAIKGMMDSDEELREELERTGRADAASGRYSLLGKMIIKRSHEGGSLMQEYTNTRYFHEKLGTRVAEPLALVQHEDRDYLITKTAGNTNLARAMRGKNQNERARLLKRAAKLLAHIHCRAEQGEDEGKMLLRDIANEDPDYYQKRIENILFHYDDADVTITIDDDDRRAIMESYSAIASGLRGLPTGYYSDHSPNNTVVNDYGELVEIDFEGDKSLPCHLDLVTLLEFGSAYACEGQERSIVNEYLKEKRRLTGKKTDLNEFMQAYPYAAVQRHLELIGYRSRDVLGMIESGSAAGAAELSEDRRYHLNKAVQHAKEIIHSCGDESQRRLMSTLITALSHVRIETITP